MTIADPNHWIEEGFFKGPKYDKIVEMIGIINGLGGAHASTHEDGGGDEIDGNLDLAGLKLGSAPASFVADIDTVMPASPTDTQLLTSQAIKEWVSCNNVTSPISIELGISFRMQFLASQYTNYQSTDYGAHQWATGTQYMYFCINPPDWLIRHCEDRSLDLKLLSIICRWNNEVSADYMKRVKYYWIDGDTANRTELHDSLPITLGQGSTGFRNDAFDGTDSVAFTRGDWFYVRVDVQQGTVGSCKIKSFQGTYSFS